MFTFLRGAMGRITRWRSGADLVFLLALLTLVLGVWGFFLIASAVRAGSTQRLDEDILRSLRDPADLSRPIGPTWMHEMGRDMTALGGVAFLCLLTLVVAGF